MNDIINIIQAILFISCGVQIIALIRENKRIRRHIKELIDNVEEEAKRATKWFNKYIELRNGIQSVIIPKHKPKQDPP